MAKFTVKVTARLDLQVKLNNFVPSSIKSVEISSPPWFEINQPLAFEIQVEAETYAQAEQRAEVFMLKYCGHRLDYDFLGVSDVKVNPSSNSVP
jgi:hypothetical protein